jgi:ABC-type transport system substrate-binding protein
MSDHDPARAQALLDLHGYVDRDGDGWREQPDGRPLVLRLAGTATLQDRTATRCGSAAWTRWACASSSTSSWPELLKKSRAGSLMMWGYSWSAVRPTAASSSPSPTAPTPPRPTTRASPAGLRPPVRAPARAARRPEREALMRQAKNLLVAYMPYKVHLHNVRIDLAQPWLQGYWRHPFMREHARYVDIAG